MIHPLRVHFPLALLPTAIAADAVGAMTDNRALMDMGKTFMPLAVASMAATGVAGFAAQEEVRAEGEAHDMLVTHRNLNVGLLLMSAGPAVLRSGQERPGRGYLLAGLAGAALMTYTGYLGGKMIYRHGVGAVEGHDPDHSVRIERGHLGEAARIAATDVARGVAHAAQQVAHGELAPHLRRGRAPPRLYPRSPKPGDERQALLSA
ncbi:hypothetical protein Rumeso_00887 [Rubellimicrobium mesophilum DSM 19309]|uniref:DUF2231 domain-containing protein n=1 Tax=Rubellimicrobium mesophilum DSM 19309 TaxID=442562 RepID=A0A017HSJ7_9RHOB|nr:hypothetical protein Rumeso_00887 [Rubellimicrobium mesophilum DSM 19309]